MKYCLVHIKPNIYIYNCFIYLASILYTDRNGYILFPAFRCIGSMASSSDIDDSSSSDNDDDSIFYDANDSLTISEKTT